MEADGLKATEYVWSVVEGDTPAAMAKSVSLSILELSSIFERIKPDLVVTVADRYETIATAIAARYMNIPVAHTQGGEVSGSIDESVRHAVTKLANLHFPATKKSAENLIKMGESEDSIFAFGCPSIDLAYTADLKMESSFFADSGGVGDEIDATRPYVVVLQHPVTTEFGQTRVQIRETLAAMKDLASKGLQIIWLWPNIDAGSDEISNEIRGFRETNDAGSFRFYKNFEAEDYLRLISNASCLVGNSSSGLRESAFLGIPVVNIGSRQNLRERASNVVNVGHDRNEIIAATQIQLSKVRYPTSDIFGDGKAGQKIAEKLALVPLKVEKTISYVS
jgi:UDP-hydrolysing UDP-N-acetyl-D-glucosamine 2-epimerase